MNKDKNMNRPVITHSIITCPYCRHQKEEEMPVDACVHFYTCEKCGQRIKPKTGDCCVFCSYGTMKCPSVQIGENYCASKAGCY